MIITLDDEKIDTEALINEIRFLNKTIDSIAEGHKYGKGRREMKREFLIEFNMVEKRDNLKTRLDDLNLNKKWASKLDKTEEESSAIAVINREFEWVDSGVSMMDSHLANVHYQGNIIIDSIVNFWNDSPSFGVIFFMPVIIGFLNTIFSLLGVDAANIMWVMVISACAFIAWDTIKTRHKEFNREENSFWFYMAIFIDTLLRWCALAMGVIIVIHLTKNDPTPVSSDLKTSLINSVSGLNKEAVATTLEAERSATLIRCINSKSSSPDKLDGVVNECVKQVMSYGDGK